MRSNLVTPFAEKDPVKALGARWDAAKTCWYIFHVAALSPYVRWIPAIEAETVFAGDRVQKTNVELAPSPIAPATTVNAQAKTAACVADCGCDVLPWDDCVHTAKP